MIGASGFLDPRGQPRDGMMPFIGGPKDGESWSMHMPLHFQDDAFREQYAGRYVYADQREWAFVWLPFDSPRPAWA